MAGLHGTNKSVNSSPDNIGKKYGSLTVVGIEHCTSGNGHTMYMWRCRCDCGNEKLVTPSVLKRHPQEFCGRDCKNKQATRVKNVENKTRHGGSKTRLYRIYHGMKDRCTNENTSYYRYYGARGISVCDEWCNDYIAFRDWALANGYTDELTIDRIDCNGDYCPDNCRWVTMKVQQNNRTNNHLISYNGETHTISEWSEITGIRVGVINNRLKCGRSSGEALGKERITKKGSTPVLQYTIEGEFVKEWPSSADVERAGIAKGSAVRKCCAGWPHYNTAAGYVWKNKRDVY